MAQTLLPSCVGAGCFAAAPHLCFKLFTKLYSWRSVFLTDVELTDENCGSIAMLM